MIKIQKDLQIKKNLLNKNIEKRPKEKNHDNDLTGSIIYESEEDDCFNLSKNDANSIEFENLNNEKLNFSNKNICETYPFFDNTDFNYDKLTETINEEKNERDEINSLEKNEKYKNKIKKNVENKLISNIDEKFIIIEKENLKLKKENFILIQELEIKKLEISKISFDKFSLLTELNELLSTLQRVDLNLLNNFYFNNMKYDTNNYKNDIHSDMGIKFNVLSAINRLGIMSLNSISFIDQNKENYNPEYEFLSKKINEDFEYSQNIFTKNYMEIVRNKIKQFENELNNFIARNPENLIRNYSSYNTR